MSLIHIDVNESLSKLIPIPLNDLNELDSSINNLNISHGSFNNELNMNELNLNRFVNLESIEIGNESFHILNCESLKVIEIGCCSFCDFGGEFELRNLDNLESIKIGRIGRGSANFYWSSFIIRGKNVK